jgi:hypothetical protein
MQKLTLEQAADYLEAATVERSHDAGYEIIHVGWNASGTRFIMVNNCYGETSISEIA